MSSFRFGAAAGIAMLGSIFTDNASALSIHSISPTDLTIDNLPGFSQNKLSPSNPTPASCPVKIVEYFSKTQLQAINTQLGTLKDWMNDNYFFDHDFIEDVLGEEDDHTGIKQAFYDSYNNIMDYHSVYNPGTEMGMIYLSDPISTVGAIFAYTDYAEQLKNILKDIGYEREFAALSGFNPTLKKLRGYAEGTESAIVAQVVQGCSQVLSPS